MYYSKSRLVRIVYFEVRTLKPGIGNQVFHILPALLRRTANLAIDAFFSYESTPAYAQLLAILQVPSSEFLRISDRYVFIKGYDLVGRLWCCAHNSLIGSAKLR